MLTNLLIKKDPSGDGDGRPGEIQSSLWTLHQGFFQTSALKHAYTKMTDIGGFSPMYVGLIVNIVSMVGIGWFSIPHIMPMMLYHAVLCFNIVYLINVVFNYTDNTMVDSYTKSVKCSFIRDESKLLDDRGAHYVELYHSTFNSLQEKANIRDYTKRVWDQRMNNAVAAVIGVILILGGILMAVWGELLLPYINPTLILNHPMVLWSIKVLLNVATGTGQVMSEAFAKAVFFILGYGTVAYSTIWMGSVVWRAEKYNLYLAKVKGKQVKLSIESSVPKFDKNS